MNIESNKSHATKYREIRHELYKRNDTKFDLYTEPENVHLAFKGDAFHPDGSLKSVKDIFDNLVPQDPDSEYHELGIETYPKGNIQSLDGRLSIITHYDSNEEGTAPESRARRVNFLPEMYNQIGVESHHWVSGGEVHEQYSSTEALPMLFADQTTKTQSKQD